LGNKVKTKATDAVAQARKANKREKDDPKGTLNKKT